MAVKKPTPNPAQKLIKKIMAEQAVASARIKKLLDRITPGMGKGKRRRLNAKIQREIRLLERNTEMLATQASEKATMTGVVQVGKNAAKLELVIKRLSSERKHRLLLSNQKKIVRDFKVVYKELGDRFDDLIVKGVTKRRLTSTVTKNIATALRQETIQTDILRQILKDEVKLIASNGARWDPLVYAKMVARTRTREYMSAGLEAQMKNNNFPFYQVSKHKTPAGEPMDEPCKVIEGNVYSYPWASKKAKEKHPVAPFRVPVHPSCKHVETPVFEVAA